MSVLPPSPLDALAPPTCLCGYGDDCVCPPTEKALRFVSGNHAKAPLTPEQREWCFTEIDKVEGYKRKDYESEDDPVIANGVLCAWVDYCRDKGLM